MTTDIRRLELAVIAIAQKWRSDVLAGASNDIKSENIALLRERVDALTHACDECNAGGHTCPGDGNPIPHGTSDCGEHTHAGADGACPDTLGPEDDGALRDELAAEVEAEEELIWVPRTWADVRTGDAVRLPGTENYAHVSHAVHQCWRVDPRTGTSGFNPPRALEWSAVHVVLHTVIPGQGMASQAGEFDMDPAKPIDIKLTRSEVDALNAFDAAGLDGWRSRVGLIEVTPDATDRDI